MQGGKVRCNINFVTKSTSYISIYNPFKEKCVLVCCKSKLFNFKEKCYV